MSGEIKKNRLINGKIKKNKNKESKIIF